MTMNKLEIYNELQRLLNKTYESLTAYKARQAKSREIATYLSDFNSNLTDDEYIQKINDVRTLIFELKPSTEVILEYGKLLSSISELYSDNKGLPLNYRNLVFQSKTYAFLNAKLEEYNDAYSKIKISSNQNLIDNILKFKQYLDNLKSGEMIDLSVVRGYNLRFNSLELLISRYNIDVYNSKSEGKALESINSQVEQMILSHNDDFNGEMMASYLIKYLEMSHKIDDQTYLINGIKYPRLTVLKNFQILSLYEIDDKSILLYSLTNSQKVSAEEYQMLKEFIFNIKVIDVLLKKER